MKNGMADSGAGGGTSPYNHLREKKIITVDTDAHLISKGQSEDPIAYQKTNFQLKSASGKLCPNYITYLK